MGPPHTLTPCSQATGSTTANNSAAVWKRFSRFRASSFMTTASNGTGIPCWRLLGFTTFAVRTWEAGRSLSKSCVNALVQSGEVSQAEVDRRKAAGR